MDDTVTISSFTPMTQLNNNQTGLAGPSNSISTAKITGTNLTNGKKVTVLDPPNSHTPVHQWNGTTMQATPDGTECTVLLRQVIGGVGQPPGGPRSDPTQVSATVGSTTTTTTVQVGSALLVSGTYSIKCCGSAGTAVWLAETSTTSVVLQTTLNPQTWNLNPVPNTTGGYYTVQNSGNNQYLNWSATGVALGANSGSASQWQLTTLSDGSILILTASTASQQYLYGNTSNGTVSLLSAPDTTGNGTSWATSSQARR